MSRALRRQAPLFGKSGDLRARLGRIRPHDRADHQLLANGGVLATDCLTVLAQNRELVLELRNRSWKRVPPVGVLSNDAQGLVLAHPTNPDRWVGPLRRFRVAHGAGESEVLATEIAAFLGPQEFAHAQRLVELREPRARGRKRQPIHPVFGFGIASA